MIYPSHTTYILSSVLGVMFFYEFPYIPNTLQNYIH